MLFQLPSPAPGQLESWLLPAVAVLSIAPLVKKVFPRKRNDDEFVSKTELHHELNTVRDKIDARFLTLSEKLDHLSAYYLDSTWETQLPTFKTAAEQNVYQRLPDGTAILDGYPIVWTDVLQAYTTAAAADTPNAVFGAMSFWWMGEHGSPRLDTSEHVYFANDQLAIRFIE